MNSKYLFLRRFTQLLVMVLYIAGNYWGMNWLMQGDLSSSLVLQTIPLSDPFAVLQIFFAGVSVTTTLLIGALIITIFYLLVGGRVFCSWVCPINPVTDLANYLRRKLNINQIAKKQPMSRGVRYWIFALSLLLSFILGVTAFELVSPIGIAQRAIVFGVGLSWSAILVIFLFDLFILKNGWCGHICPLGGFYAILGKFSLIRVDHNKDNCTLCMKCKEVCPETQVLFMVGKSSEQVLSGECTNCGRCIDVCNDDALNFSIRNLKGDKNGISKEANN